MRVEDIAVALKKRQQRLQELVFSKPPQNYEEFVRQQGIWQGLGDALSIIQDAVRKANEDEANS